MTLELGGSDPVIVCADADVDAAVKAVIIGRYWNAGQACLGCKRVFVHDSVYDEFVSDLVARVGRYEPGDGTVKAEKPRLRMGPIHTRAGRDELVAQIEEGSLGRRGADRRRDRRADKGWFLEPAVIAEPAGGLAADDARRCSGRCFRYAVQGLRRGDSPCKRHPVRPGIVDVDPRRAPLPSRGAGDRLGNDLGQPDPLRLRRAAVRRPQGVGFGKEHGIEAMDYYVEIKSLGLGGLD